MIEARRVPDGHERQYALSPSTIYPLRASGKEREVWNLPDRYASNKPTDSRFISDRCTVED